MCFSGNKEFILFFQTNPGASGRAKVAQRL